MATLTMPTRTDGVPDYGFTSVLEGKTYGFDFLWQGRTGCWSMTISAEDGTILLSSRRLVLGAGITRRFKDPRLPPGDFILIDTSRKGLEAGLYDLGARVLLLYIESSGFTEALR